MRCLLIKKLKFFFIKIFRKDEYKHKKEHEFEPYKSLIDSYQPAQLKKNSFINI